MQDLLNWVASSAATIALALLAGAGGSAILELLWKPRRDRKRAATLLVSEIALNTELLLLHAHARAHKPQQIPADLRMSTIGWEAASDLLSELPRKRLRALVVLYNRYHSLNRQNALFSEAVVERLTATGPAKANAEGMALASLHAFNGGVDAAIDQGKELLLPLMGDAGWKEDSEERSKVVDYAKSAAAHMQKRDEQIAKSSVASDASSRPAI